MNNEQKFLVQSSFRGVLGISDLVSDLFYRRLFLLDPSLKPMFRGDIQQQGLGDAFTPAVAAAWVEVYTVLANVMKAAAAAQIEETKALQASASRRVTYSSAHLSQPPPASTRLVPPPSSRLGPPSSVRGALASYANLPTQPPNA